jgi:hypothetical protein
MYVILQRALRRARALLPGPGYVRASRPVRRPQIEALEPRDVPSVVQPDYILYRPGGVTPFSTSGPTGLIPSQIRHAYGFDQIAFANGTVAGDGSGTTIAIVDAYDDPNIAGDLHQFDVRLGLPDPTFTKVNQTGGTTPPSPNHGWAGEIALDVEWAHAIAPGANILLVEANDNSNTNLYAAVRYAASQLGVVAVSMSWGGGESSGETSTDSSTFQAAGVTFVASSGDHGAPDSYPAASPNVLAVGGTTLHLNSSGTISSESGWSGSGGGISSVENQPSYQNGVVTQSSNRRTDPDVAYDADPSTGFSIDDSYNNSASAPWTVIGGTSDAAPQWAALIAIADQGRAEINLGPLNGRSQLLPMLYGLSAVDYHDITTGTSTGSPHESAGPGYDLVTGLGTPLANRVVADLVGPQQGGFEAPNLGTGSGAYQDDPSGTAWAFAGTAGVAGNGSAVTAGNPSAPEGTQVGFLQGSGSAISQSVSFGAGTFSLRFVAAQAASNPTSQTMQVQIDGNVVATVTPSGTGYAAYNTNRFAVAAGAHAIGFVGLDPDGLGNTILLDQVQVIRTITGYGFEGPNVGTGSGAYQYDPTGPPLTYVGNAGVAGNGSDLGNPDAPEGTQVGFLQGTGGFSATGNLAAGTYSIAFEAAQFAGNLDNETFQVLVDGVVVGTFTPGDTSYTAYTTSSFTVAGGPHTVSVVGLDPGGENNTVFLDNFLLVR